MPSPADRPSLPTSRCWSRWPTHLLSKDAGIKLRRYAHVQVPQYWIVHLDRRQVEVYRDPHGRHGKACYRIVEIYPDDVEIPVVIEGKDLGRIAVKEILP